MKTKTPNTSINSDDDLEVPEPRTSPASTAALPVACTKVPTRGPDGKFISASRAKWSNTVGMPPDLENLFRQMDKVPYLESDEFTSRIEHEWLKFLSNFEFEEQSYAMDFVGGCLPSGDQDDSEPQAAFQKAWSGVKKLIDEDPGLVRGYLFRALLAEKLIARDINR